MKKKKSNDTIRTVEAACMYKRSLEIGCTWGPLEDSVLHNPPLNMEHSFCLFSICLDAAQEPFSKCRSLSQSARSRVRSRQVCVSIAPLFVTLAVICLCHGQCSHSHPELYCSASLFSAIRFYAQYLSDRCFQSVNTMLSRLSCSWSYSGTRCACEIIHELDLGNLCSPPELFILKWEENSSKFWELRSFSYFTLIWT